MTEMTKMIGESWRGLGASEKEVWAEKSEELKKK